MSVLTLVRVPHKEGFNISSGGYGAFNQIKHTQVCHFKWNRIIYERVCVVREYPVLKIILKFHEIHVIIQKEMKK